MTDIIDTLLDLQELEIFSTALQTAGLDRDLNSGAEFTVFAPNNRAFTKLSKLTLESLSQNISLLIRVIGTHIIEGKLSQQDLVRMYDLGTYKVIRTSIAGLAISIDLSDGITIDKSRVVATGRFTDKVIVYPVDRLISGSLVAV
jgi:uncharacterized surface protein with fasciclin (FAS1) repeats